LKYDISTEWSLLLKEIYQKAEPYLEARKDLLHTQIAHGFAKRLLYMQGGDRAVVEPAIILHDIGWSAVDHEKIGDAFGVKAERRGEAARQINRIHEIQGAAIARDILQSLGYEESLIAQITTIIERHDSGTDPESLEEKLVKDADKLWRYSEAGFWIEMERQKVDPVYFYERLIRRRKVWLITDAALGIAKEELELRKAELERMRSLGS
jgi:HD superfamily phosphodiesterase